MNYCDTVLIHLLASSSMLLQYSLDTRVCARWYWGLNSGLHSTAGVTSVLLLLVCFQIGKQDGLWLASTSASRVAEPMGVHHHVQPNVGTEHLKF
jgi:hypothetical protein